MGILYIVSTPIGNLQDITIRAIKALFEADVIACEDTRRAGILLEQMSGLYNNLTQNDNGKKHKPKLLSYYDQIEFRRIPEIVSLLQSEQKVALISDAGTPAISDPGFKLIRECIKMGVKIEVVPGASSVTTALTASGLPTDKFIFLGYPPHKSGHRRTFFENTKKSQEFIKSTIIFFVAPHKLIRNLEEVKEIFGDIEIVLCRELTKIHEEIRREKISQAILHFQKTAPKGEFVLLFNLQEQ
ncbi:16S rRNA (cytidine(1402)-2'-O)-methyltransferase [Patescibacteria group bacterium]|nr:16S rRNA (cytidine(1402)-2'-O)-methyltransferase [Patescibacteria group bacterium]MBU4015888.1 16S rRNA (cytidine(1402)-2'-O)-methyltransferase [Patescibacteria group bacterium]MBU4098946.1 16S rRNA (cytidine(1402)-2'-O)-methyltransferase [Patescibacteria group bacterium]